jgi:hypothetical protein
MGKEYENYVIEGRRVIRLHDEQDDAFGAYTADTFDDVEDQHKSAVAMLDAATNNDGSWSCIDGIGNRTKVGVTLFYNITVGTQG